MPSPSLLTLSTFRVGIIAAKSKEASIIANSLFSNPTQLKSVPGLEGFTFWTGKIQRQQGGPIECYVTSGYQQGIQAFSIALSRLLFTLKTEMVLHTGVCAARADTGISLGDVILADTALNFEEGKWESATEFLPSYRPQCVLPSADFGDFIDHLRQTGEVKDKPNYHHGCFISGCAVRKDAQSKMTKLAETCNRDVAALDMEASAFLEYCVQHSNQVICLGVIKGVSDFADGMKGKYDTANGKAPKETALEEAGTAINRWIRYKVEGDALAHRELDTHQLGVRLAQGYYNNFIEPIIGLVGRLKTDGRLVTVPQDNVHRGEIRSIDTPPHHLLLVSPEQRDGDLNLELYSKENFKQAVTHHGLQSTAIIGPDDARTCFYKHGCLVDFPRSLAHIAHSLSSADHIGDTPADRLQRKTAQDQARLFLKRLEDLTKNSFYLPVKLVDWAVFNEWCNNGRLPKD